MTRPVGNYTREVHEMDFTPEALREARELAGLTAAELGERAHVHRVTISNAERGLVPSSETWQKLRSALRAALRERIRDAARARRKLAA